VDAPEGTAATHAAVSEIDVGFYSWIAARIQNFAAMQARDLHLSIFPFCLATSLPSAFLISAF